MEAGTKEERTRAAKARLESVDVFEARRQPLQGFAIGSAPRQQYRDGVTGIFGILEEGPRLFQRPGLVKIGGAGVHDPVRFASQAGA